MLVADDLRLYKLLYQSEHRLTALQREVEPVERDTH